MSSAMVAGMQASASQQNENPDKDFGSQSDSAPLSKRIESILLHFEKLNDLYLVGGSEKDRHLKKQE